MSGLLIPNRKIRMAAIFVLASFILGPAGSANSSQQTQNAPADSSNTPAPTSAKSNRPRSRAVELSQHAIEHYQTIWGVDSFVVRSVESGQMIRFSYRVIDAEKAAAVNDKKATPYLIDEAAHVKLVVPMMEKVGQLRQSAAPESGKSYWMVFSNKGGFVKQGDRVSVEIGKFRVDGLVIE
jgi:hypothetical protein